MSVFRRMAARAVDVVFPPQCFVCGGPGQGSNRGLCTVCAGGLDSQLREPACPTCASSVAPFEVSGGRCRRCRGERERLSGIVRVGAYEHGLRTLLRAYKFHDRLEIEAGLGAWLAEVAAAAAWRSRVEAIVAVPTHWRRRITCPSYPADALSRSVARGLDLPLTRILRRTRAGPHQIGLSYTARAANVRGAFALRRGVELCNARLLLIDDVRTTGATINECAKVLQKNGAAEVYAAVVVVVGFDGPTGVAIRSI